MPLTKKQSKYIDAVLSRKYLYLLFGGAVGGGKTFLILGLLDEMCYQYPGIRVGVVRKTLTTLRRNTIPSFKKILEINGTSKQVLINKSEWVAKYPNGSEMVFIEANEEKDPDFNKLKGLELTVAAMEEANEMVQKAFSILITRVGRWKNDIYNIPPQIYLSCNPADNWVKFMFYDLWSENILKPPYFYLPALPIDNEYLPQSYIDGLEYLPEPEYKRFAKGNWDYSDDPNQLIQYIWLKNNRNEENKIPKYLGVDAGREGDDPTIFCFGNDKGICWFEAYYKQKTHITKELARTRMQEYNILQDFVAIDTIGLGAGVVDGLEDEGIVTREFIAGAKPAITDKKYLPIVKHFKFKNKRAEAAWLLRECIRKDEYEISNDEFIKEATSIKYFVKEGYIQIEPKEAIKKRLGKSTDYFDAAMIMNYVRLGFLGSGFSFIDLIDKEKKEEPRRKNKTEERFIMGKISSKMRY